MAETTGIQWADATWNPWMGCHKVSPGCKNCYMFREMKFYGKSPNVVARSKTTFDAPLKWARSGKVKPGARIFTCSWSDWFVAEADAWRAEAWRIVRETPYVYLILTKRTERMAECLPRDWGRNGYPNVWLVASAEDQTRLNKRLPELLSVPAAVHGLSAEPLLGPLNFQEAFELYFRRWREAYERQGWPLSLRKIKWVITGGESDPKSPRPCDLDWVRSIRDQCAEKVAFFHKQHGGQSKINGTWGGRELDGRTWDEFPETEFKYDKLEVRL